MTSATATIPQSPSVAPTVSSTAALTLANVLYEKKGAIAYVTVNRPKVLNALNTPTWQDLRTAFEDARDDAAVRGVILTGAGDKAFIAGADISELAHVTRNRGRTVQPFRTGGARSHRESRQAGDRGRSTALRSAAAARRRWPAPSGSRWSTRSSASRKSSSDLLPGGGGTQRLPRLVGKGRALQLILSGEMISAQEAYRIGLVNEVVPAADLIPRAEAILKKIAANAPIAVKFALEAANKGMETSQSEGLLLEASYFGLCAGTEDKKEGTSAFLEKRAPQFHGR